MDKVRRASLADHMQYLERQKMCGILQIATASHHARDSHGNETILSQVLHCSHLFDGFTSSRPPSGSQHLNLLPQASFIHADGIVTSFQAWCPLLYFYWRCVFGSNAVPSIHSSLYSAWIRSRRRAPSCTTIHSESRVYTMRSPSCGRNKRRPSPAGET